MSMFPFILGCPRSGTTLARLMLNEHSQLAIFPESRFVTRYARHRHRYEKPDGFDHARFAADVVGHEKFHQWKLDPDAVRADLERARPADYPDAVRTVFGTYATTNGKPHYGDKTPTYTSDVVLLATLFPEAKFVHVIRDGRNTALSLVENPFGPTTVAHGILYWSYRIENARAAAQMLPPGTYMEYRHEDLVEDPEAMLRKICAFLDLPYEDGLLAYHTKREESEYYGNRNTHKPPTKDLRDWRQQMSVEDQRIAEILAGEMLADLGYELSTDASTLLTQETELQRRAATIRIEQAAWEERWWRRVNRRPLKDPKGGARQEAGAAR